MKKNKNKKKINDFQTTRGRDTVAISRRTSLPLSTFSMPVQEDRRFYHPLGGLRPARNISGGVSRLKLRDRAYSDPNQRRIRNVSQTKAVVAFARPDKTVICQRRKARREILHARRIAGGTGFKRPRFTWMSKISCRR